MTPAVTVRGLLDARPESVGLSIDLLAGASGLERHITSPYIQKTGLALAGFHEYLQPGRILLFGESEVRFLESLEPGSAAPGAGQVLQRRPAVPAGHRRRRAAAGGRASKASGPACRSCGRRCRPRRRSASSPRCSKIASRIREIIHGVLIDILGLGVLIVGESGIGKSECALDLVVRGHRLVADDTVEVRRRSESIVIGSCPEMTRHHMEVRGLGLINIRDLFGVASTRTSKRVELVVQLDRWDQGREYDRLGLDDASYDLIGLKVPLIRMPVAHRTQPGHPRRGRRAQSAAAHARHQRRARAGGAARRQPRRTRCTRAPEAPDARRRRRDRAREARREQAAQASTSWARFIVLTGLSGSGKSQAIRALEDLGYYCVDNLPVSLLPVMAELSERQTEHNRVAVVMDIREPRFVSDFPRVYRKLKTNKHLAHAADLPGSRSRRAGSPVQRNAPAASAGAGSAGHRRPLGRARLAARRSAALADKVIDTSKLNVHELRQQLRELVSGRKQASKLVLTFVSFGFQNGPPAEADLMFDVRFLKNPHWVPALRPKTGKDPAGRGVYSTAADRARRDQEAVVAAAMDGAALRAGREELPDRRHRLHRRPASFGVRRRGVEARAVGPQGRVDKRAHRDLTRKR